MDEAGLEQSLELYRTQLSQVNQAIQAAGESEDLLKLRTDLTELIDLTQDSLLSLKKSQLLASLESSSSTSQSSTAAATSSTTCADNTDDEYAAFQAALGSSAFDAAQTNHSELSTTSNISQSQYSSDESDQSEEDEPNTSVADSFTELVGMKCQAPFSHDWGGHAYHNALVFKVETSQPETEMPQVRVMFCNPTHVSMLPCRFFLDGRCRFAEEKCKYSHGHLVDIGDLLEYKDPDYSLARIGGKCFARFSDDVWHSASIVDVEEDQVTVTFTSHGNTETLDLHDILPLEHHDDSSDLSDSDNERPSTSSDPRQPVGREESESEDELPVFLWRPPKTTAALGEWEQHTKGFGSRLMAKMGYITGQGLGVRGEGRAEPVPIQLLPQGKSLDKIMELKAIAGDQDLFDAMKKLKKKKQMKAEKSSSTPVSQSPPNVFDFINKKLRGKKGSLSDLVSHHAERNKSEPSRHIAESDLHQKSDRHLNIQSLKTSEEIRKVEKELQRLRKSLCRNKDRDKSMANQVQQKISSTEAYLEKLKSSELVLERHKQKRNDHKKLTIF